MTSRGTGRCAAGCRIADHVALFWVVDGSGTIVEHGPTEQIFGSPRHEFTAAYVRGAHG
jgi:phosphate transport system ATP-binding protein